MGLQFIFHYNEFLFFIRSGTHLILNGNSFVEILSILNWEASVLNLNRTDWNTLLESSFKCRDKIAS